MSTELQVALFSAALVAAGWLIVRVESLGRSSAHRGAQLDEIHRRVTRIEDKLDSL